MLWKRQHRLIHEWKKKMCVCVFLSLRARSSLEERKRISLSVYSRLFFYLFIYFVGLFFSTPFSYDIFLNLSSSRKFLNLKRKNTSLEKLTFSKMFCVLLCSRWNVLCSRHHLLPFSFIHAPIFFSWSRGGNKEKEKR